MTHQYIILCRSLTYAQRAERALLSSGLSASVARSPAGVPAEGCGYAVRVRATRLGDALAALEGARLPIGRAFVAEGDAFREVYR